MKDAIGFSAARVIPTAPLWHVKVISNNHAERGADFGRMDRQLVKQLF